MKHLLILIGVVVPMVMLSCRQASHAGTGPDVPSRSEISRELPLPTVPSEMRTVEQRAGYVMYHFWDAMDFGNTELCGDSAFIEQNFVNFISLYPHAPKEVRPKVMGRFVEQAAVNQVALSAVWEVAEKYLDNPNSPLRNEECYILFLEELLRTSSLDKGDRMRARFQLATAMKNRPETKAANFRFVDRNGKTGSLRQTEGEYTLLIFYDPECEHCTDLLRQAAASISIREGIERGRLAVLAVYAEGKRRVWDDTKHLLPLRWKVAFDTDGVLERELYALPAMPVFYLLDRDKTVILKDAPLAAIDSYLQT